MARHTAGPKSLTRALVRVGLTVTVAGAALGAGGAGSAGAAPEPAAPSATDDVSAAGAGLLQAVQGATASGLGPAKDLKLNPLAGTGVDPLDNAVGTRIADFKPISTAAVTGPLAGGDSLDELPLVGPATGLLPG
ncbi:hypothetical protein ACIBKX_11630 [Streptomyces sp. NPDC050658]|uniref:hypothetical protein n=1 Tax=unclassified Streptomyces TaxID=2593676 RepID=UPI00343B6441